MNINDYLTGLAKVKCLKKEFGSAGAGGMFKKFSYWIVIGIAFLASKCFTYMGDIVGVNLSFVELFGWCTLASYLVNEIKSILRNLAEMDVRLPIFLVTGLDIIQKLLDAKIRIDNEQEEN